MGTETEHKAVWLRNRFEEAVGKKIYELFKLITEPDPDLQQLAELARVLTSKEVCSAGATIMSEGQTPLTQALRFHGGGVVLNTLIQAGFDLNQPNRSGYTPLTAAIDFDNIQAVRALIKARADLNKPDGNGRTPLEIAEQSENVQAFNALVKAGADREQLSLAARNSIEQAVEKAPLYEAALAVLTADAPQPPGQG